MSDVGSDAEPRATADVAPLPEQGGGVRVPRSRGVVSGVVLLLAGVWAAFVPFVGPAFHFAYTPKPHETWHWTAARGWFEVLPGGLAVFGGLLLILSANRILTSLGAWLAVLAGGWLIVGQQVSYLLTLGSPGAPSAAGDRRYVAEYLAFFTGIGALIVLFGALAAGRLSVRSVRDVRAAARRAEQAAVAEQEAAEREARERDAYVRADADRDATDRNAEAWAGGYRDAGYGTPGATAPLPVAPLPGEPPAAPPFEGYGRSASAVTSELPVAGRDDERYRRHAAGPDDDTTAMPVVPEPVAAQPTEPVAASEPTVSEPAVSEPAVSEPAVSEPTGFEHAAPEPMTPPEPAPTVESTPEPEPEPTPEPEPEGGEPPIVLDPPADHPDAERSDPVAGAAPASGTATAWNPEAQSPTTAGEFPAVDPTPTIAPDAPSAAGSPPAGPPPRGVQLPRRYFGPNNPAPQDDAISRDPVRTDEADDLDDLDLDEPTR